MKYAIKLAVILAPIIFISALFYLATVENKHGWKLYDFVFKKINSPVEGHNNLDSPSNRQAGNDASSTTVPAKDNRHSTIRPLYKWRDKNNTIVISTESPPADIHAETFYFQTENKTSTDVLAPDTVANTQKRTLSDVSFVDNPISVYTPAGLKQLIDYSKEIGDKIELRGEELNTLVEQLQDR